MTRRPTLPALAIMLALPAAVASAQQPETPGDPARGTELARARCTGSGCHQVGAGEQGQAGSAGAISFRELADREDSNNMQLLDALEEARHPRLPGPQLERQQLRDIVAYIRAMTTGDRR